MTQTRTVLVVDDDEATRLIVRRACEQACHLVLEAADGPTGLQLATTEAPAVVILDINMPGMSGYDVCRRLRGEGLMMPIIMLTTKGETVDRVVGLELGADDYVTKPFEPRELLARIEAHTRRAQTQMVGKPDRLDFPKAEISIDLGRREVTVRGTLCPLTLTEFNLLVALAQRRDVMTRQLLLRTVWGYEVEIETRTVDAHIYRLRRKLEISPDHSVIILSVPGVGYRFAG